MTSHTQRTLAALRKSGLVPAVVERWNPHAPRPGGGRGIRQDLFGCIDILALDPAGGPILAVQSTGQDYAGHMRKLLGERRAMVRLWLLSGNALELWAWRKVKVKRGGKAKRWAPRIRVLSLSDVEGGDIYL